MYPTGLLSRAAAAAGRTARARAGGGPAKSFWSAGVRDSEGRLFSETPPPPGQRRKWESWEAVWYLTLAAATAVLGVGLTARPDSSIATWAKGEAAKELGE